MSDTKAPANRAAPARSKKPATPPEGPRHPNKQAPLPAYPAWWWFQG